MNFLQSNVCIMIQILLKFIPMGPIHNKTTLVLELAKRRTSHKPLPEPLNQNLRRHMALQSHNELTQCICMATWKWVNLDYNNIMACFLTAPSHYFTQCRVAINKVQWHSSDSDIPVTFQWQSNFTRTTSDIRHWNQLENYYWLILKIIQISQGSMN